MPATAPLLLLAAAAPPRPGRTANGQKLHIPTRTIAHGGKLPMLVLGDGASWGSGSNYTLWIDLVGKGEAGINTAWDYGRSPTGGSQKDIPAQIAVTGAAREDVFITSMVPCSGYDGGVEPMNASMAEKYIATDLAELQTPYLDLLLLHHACPTFEETAKVWGALEAARQAGKARAIGVSNFDAPDLARLMAVTKEPIAVNQCHFAVGQMDTDMIAYSAAHGIALEAYSTLRGTVPMSHPTVASIATAHNVSAAVVMMRYVSMHNISVVTASDNLKYDTEDAAMFSVELTAAEITSLDALQTGKRTCSDCRARPCVQCRDAIQKAGCQPGGDGTGCIACAATNSGVVMPTCGANYMVAKACVL